MSAFKAINVRFSRFDNGDKMPSPWNYNIKSDIEVLMENNEKQHAHGSKNIGFSSMFKQDYEKPSKPNKCI